jgi:chaperonin GroES
MKLRPLQDWAVVRPDQPQERTVGGIVIPEVAKERPQEGTVLAIGEGYFEEPDKSKKEKSAESKKDRKFIQTTLKSGDRVVYEKYSGTQIEVEGEDLVLVKERDILGVMDV